MPEALPSELVTRIKDKRQQVDRFIASAVPRKRRLLNLTIIGGTLAAAFTAGPAVGGQPFATWLTAALGLSSPSWRLLCGAASICSVAATIATQLLKANNVEERVTRALSCRAKLDVLELGIATGQLSAADATNQYIRCAEETAFLDA
jgi:hypothetical protein